VPEIDNSDAMNASNSPFPEARRAFEFPFVDKTGSLIEDLSGTTLRIYP